MLGLVIEIKIHNYLQFILLFIKFYVLLTSLMRCIGIGFTNELKRDMFII